MPFRKLLRIILDGIHDVKECIVLEVHPGSGVGALQATNLYNLSTSAYKKDISFDQYNINSYAMDYATSTSYMRLGNTNILTLGMGYHYKSFYIDLAYKIRHQKADFYTFDTNFANSNQEFVPQFVIDNPDYADLRIDPVGVDLTRQAITCTLGFKF